jgi:ribonucleoside-triphosphate reductase
MPLEQTPAESTAYRFAKLDMKYFPLQTPTVVRGNKGSGEIYYTNSTYLNVGADISAIERVKAEGRFHPLIDAGSLTHVWLGESKPPAESIAAFVVKTFQTTNNAQICFSPEFTSCLSCGKTTRGLKESCPYCGSPDIEGITRVTGFFSKTRGWNKGKMAELKDRKRNNLG